MFVDYKKPVSSQIMTMALGDINLERTMKEIITESRKRRVLLCLDDKEIPQVEKILNEENIAYRKVKETGYTGRRYFHSL